jgi:serine/threonine protein kinase
MSSASHELPSDVLLGEASPGPETIDGYRLVRLIAQGRSETVYEAASPGSGSVALKVVFATPADRRVLLARQVAECDRLSRRPHPGVLLSLGAGVWDEGIYLAMELLPGETLAAALADGAVTAVGALEAMAEVALAVHSAHEAGLVHLDLRPGRLLLAPQPAGGKPAVRVTGFGLSVRRLALLAGRLAEGEPNFFAAPEQQWSRADARADTYALGAITYALLTGGPPDTELWTASLAQSSALTGLEELTSAGWAALEATLRRALAPEPRQRFASARAFAHSLQQALRMPAAPPTDEVPCSLCGTPGTPEQNYCSRCGHRAGAPGATGPGKVSRPTLAGFAISQLSVMPSPREAGGAAWSVPTSATPAPTEITAAPAEGAPTIVEAFGEIAEVEPEAPLDPAADSASLASARTQVDSSTAIMPLPAFPPTPAAEESASESAPVKTARPRRRLPRWQTAALVLAGCAVAVVILRTGAELGRMLASLGEAATAPPPSAPTAREPSPPEPMAAPSGQATNPATNPATNQGTAADAESTKPEAVVAPPVPAGAEEQAGSSSPGRKARRPRSDGDIVVLGNKRQGGEAAPIKAAKAVAKVGQLELETETPNVAIFIDGKTCGLTPLAQPIVLPAGRHKLLGTLGELAWRNSFKIKAGERLFLRLAPEEPLANLQ